MERVSFPGLNFNFNVSKIAFSIGKIKIYWYGVIIVMALIIVLLLLRRDDNKYGIQFSKIINLFIILIPISIICARLYYVIFKHEDYKLNFLQIINIKNGGLAIYGGIIGGIITSICYCKKNKISILDTLDYIAPYLALGQAIGRWGNFFNIEAYGTETTNIFRMGIFDNVIYKEVHPTFLYESICNIIIFVILYNLSKRRKFKGEITYIYIILYSFIRMLIEGLRTDSLMIGIFRISQVLSIILFIIFLCVFIVKYIKESVEKSKKM